MQNNKVRLPAITIEVPRMGMIVYVSPRTGKQEGKDTTMFTAEITVKGAIELQSFHLKCKTLKEAEVTRDRMLKRLEGGSFLFIQNSI
jgi:hypothetical protein